MKLSIIRHAQATEASFGESDFQRVLTEKGEKQASDLAAFMRENSLVPDCVLSSPAVRCVQTAEIVSRQLELGVPLREHFLSSGMQPEAAVKELGVYREIGHLAIVGHEPDLSFLLCRLLGCDALPFRIKKGSLTVLEGHAKKSSCWTLLEHAEF